MIDEYAKFLHSIGGFSSGVIGVLIMVLSAAVFVMALLLRAQKQAAADERYEGRKGLSLRAVPPLLMMTALLAVSLGVFAVGHAFAEYHAFGRIGKGVFVPLWSGAIGFATVSTCFKALAGAE